MTYYEELGIPATASSEEIRLAYERLARFAAPDRCGDESARRRAEFRMRRLNSILEVLQDSAGREHYDRSLSALALAVSGEPSPAAPRRRGLHWMAHTAIAGAAAILILVLSLAASKPTPQIARAVPANDEWEPLATYMYESHVPIPPLPFPERGVQAQLAGDWISPESEPIALRLRGDGDLLRGRYQASGVAFAFEGQVGPGGGTLPWKGANGAKGEVTLRVLPNGDLEVEWTGAGISSGTARLVRKRD